MKGTLVGISIFCVLSFSVAFAAVGAFSQAIGSGTSGGLSGVGVSEFESFPAGAESEKQSGVYQAFTYVCPFH